MAMYPNATYGYMPFVKPAHKRQAAKKTKSDKADTLKAKSGDMKTYKVTLRDRNGFTYTYIIQADTSSKSTPILCESRVAAPRNLSSSLPNMKKSEFSDPESRRHSSCLSLAQGKEDLTKVEDSEKKGLFNSIINFIKKKTTSKSSKSQLSAMKSKRKTKPMFPKKRQRTISTMSNLDPIQESPEEDEDDDFDTDSYSHDSGSSDGSSSES